VCCSVLQCVAVCCSVLQCVAVCCSVLQCVEFVCSMWCAPVRYLRNWNSRFFGVAGTTSLTNLEFGPQSSAVTVVTNFAHRDHNRIFCTLRA